MNIFAQSNNNEIALKALEGYAWLTVAVPVMIAILVFLMLLLVIGIFSASDHLGAIRKILLGALPEPEFTDAELKEIELYRLKRRKMSIGIALVIIATMTIALVWVVIQNIIMNQ